MVGHLVLIAVSLLLGCPTQAGGRKYRARSWSHRPADLGGAKGNSQRELSSSIFTITCPLTVTIIPVFQGRDYRWKSPSHLQTAQLAHEDRAECVWFGSNHHTAASAASNHLCNVTARPSPPGDGMREMLRGSNPGPETEHLSRLRASW